jgi:hypothetical protein
VERSTLKTVKAFIILGLIVGPDLGWAFQAHPAPEGLYGHQIAHGLFILAMGILIYWLQVNDFVQQRGWRLIQMACILLMLWNLTAMLGHWVEERAPADAVIGESDWTQRIILDSAMMRLYYVLKLDHLVCVPALVCLCLGIRSLYKAALREEGHASD